ncbi:MAG: flagellar hook protein FlgE [Candidatus Marinimicrobia bacterium]|nr:flagellar hook protein FlgE [Candidatus Neomarinimicrobiota bacterium]
MDQLVRTAERIAQLTEDGDLPRDIVELISLQRKFEANAIVARMANEMLGSLLDLFA